MNPRFPLFTLGHSTHSADVFLGLLRGHGVSVVFDVRSAPYSGRYPHFSRPDMSRWLEQSQVRYFFAGKHLGGRPSDQSLYLNNQANYAEMAKSADFLSALRRLASWTRRARCALVCAEADPIDCHRFLLIGRELCTHNLDVYHILPNGTAEPHRATERRLLRKLGLLQADVFDNQADAVAAAYTIQASRVAYSSLAEGPAGRGS